MSLQPSRSRAPGVADFVVRQSNERARQPALITQDHTLTWRQLEGRVRHAASGLRASGLRRGDRFAIVDRNHAAVIETSLAAALTGTVAVVVNSDLTGPEIAQILAASHARLLFVGGEFQETIEGVRGRLDELVSEITVGGRDDEYEVWLETHETSESMYDSAHDRSGLDDPFMLVYATAPDGTLFGIELTQNMVLAHTAATAAGVPLTATDIGILAAPLHHVSGVSLALLALYQGTCMIMSRTDDPVALLSQLASERATHAFVLPDMLAALSTVPDVDGYDLTGLSHIVYGGTPMPAAMARQYLEVFRGVGLTHVEPLP